MRALPPLDLHAHIDPTIEARELVSLNAAIFAVTRSLDEAETALRRTDDTTVWGVGCHPGLAGAHKAFTQERFRRLVDHTPFVGEIGLDGKSRLPLASQLATLHEILTVLLDMPRITSIHSYAATGGVLGVLGELPTRGAVLHWWLGSTSETARAIDLGCYFSINPAMLKHTRFINSVPLERVLTETDHPFGDRSGRTARRPGLVSTVETALADVHGLTPIAVRHQLWRNLRTLSGNASVGALMPISLRRYLAAV